MSPKIDSHIAVRMARLFREAEFLTPDSYSQVLLELGAQSQTWQQFLQQDITALRLRPRRGRRVEAVERLSDPITIHLPEIVYIASTFEPDPDELLEFFTLYGSLTPQRADSMAARSEGKEELLKTLIDERVLSPRGLAEVIGNQFTYKAKELREQAASDVLVNNDVVSVEDLDHVISKSHHMSTSVHENLGEILPQEKLVSLILDDLKVPTIDLREEDAMGGWDELFPAEVVARLHFLPLERTDNHITIAVRDGLDFSIADTFAIITGCSFSLVEATGDTLEEVLGELLPKAREESHEDVADRGVVDFGDSELFSAELISTEQLQGDDLTAVDIVRRLLESAVASGATDIHLERMSGSMRVRFRVDGVLRNVLTLSPERAEPVVSRVKVLCNMDVTERRRPQDGHFTIEDRESRIDFRVSTIPTTLGEKVVLRVLDSVTLIRSFKELGLSPAQEATLRKNLSGSHGLVLVTGPTGSGKTSTLYAGLAHLNTTEKNIITIEDPVEYRVDGIAQVQVDPNIKLTFANGLRSSLRQDPDIIMVGEVRDPETAQIAIRAALTGHLVLSTLHSNTGVGGVFSLRYLGIQPFLIASSVKLFVAQRLVRRVCESCREVLDPAPSLLRDLGMEENWDGHFFEGAGCARCFYSGYRGRTGIFELLEINRRLADSIVEEVEENTLARIAREEGFEPIRVQARQKVIDGITSPEEALKEVSLVD